MPRMPHPALVWAANLVVPGSGVILAGRILWGVPMAAAWGLAACYLLAGLIWTDTVGGGLPILRIAAPLALYIAGQVVLLAALRMAARGAADASRNEQFRAALVAYLEGRLDESEALCRALLSRDRGDVEATLQLAAVARRRGNLADARHHLERARYLDDDGRWDFEIGRGLEAVEKAEAAKSPAAAQPAKPAA